MAGFFQSQISGIFTALSPFIGLPSTWTFIQQYAWNLFLKYLEYQTIYQRREFCILCIEDGKQTWVSPRQRECHVCGKDIRGGRNRVVRYVFSKDESMYLAEKEWKIFTVLQINHKEHERAHRANNQNEDTIRNLPK